MAAPIYETESLKYNQFNCEDGQIFFPKSECYLPERNVTFLCCMIFQEKGKLHVVQAKDGGFQSNNTTRELRIPKALASKINEYIKNNSVFKKESEDIEQKLYIACNKQCAELGIKELNEEDAQNLVLKEIGQEKLNALDKREKELKQTTLSIGKEFIEFANQNAMYTFE